MIETNLDSIAQQSAFRHIHPGTKLLLALGSLIISLVSPSPLIPLLSGIALSMVLLGPGRIHPVTYAKVLAGPVVFTAMSIFVLLFTLGGGEPVWQVSLLPGFVLSITTGAVHQSILILSRVFGCSISLFFIALTTPMTDLFNGMRRVGIPSELVDLMMIAYRYIFIVCNQAIEIYNAQIMRLGYSRPAEAVRSFSMLSGMLFISSWNAGEALIHAMDCRCYDGIIPSLDQAEPVRAQSLIPVLLYLIGLGTMMVAGASQAGIG